MKEDIYQEDVFPETEATAQELLAQIMVEFISNFPPGKADKYNPDKCMSTDDVFMLIDNHVPEIVTHREVAALLHKNGYISKYDKTQNEFKWLIK